MKPNIFQKVAMAVSVALVAYWCAIYFGGVRDTAWNDTFVLLYGVLAFASGIAASKGSMLWKGFSNDIGRAVSLLGAGLFLFGCGQIALGYYNFFLGLEVPYPSIADLFFVPSVFCYAAGAIFLAKTTGANFGLRNALGKFFVVFAPVAILAISFYIFVYIGHRGDIIDETSWLKTALDILYPLGDFVALAVSITVSGLSFRYMGGGYKYDILTVLSGLAVMFAADTFYSFTTTEGTAYNGDFGDLLFLFGIALLCVGTLGFNKIKNQEEVHAPQAAV